MGMSTASDVRFDFDGALYLARRLYTLGGHVDDVRWSRTAKAETALTDWTGPYGTEFADRVVSEDTQAMAIASQLREGARQWAARWAEAMNEQNAILHARETKRIEDDRSGWENFTGGIFGHDDLPPGPATIPVPSAPGFVATGSLTEY